MIIKAKGHEVSCWQYLVNHATYALKVVLDAIRIPIKVINIIIPRFQLMASGVIGNKVSKT